MVSASGSTDSATAPEGLSKGTSKPEDEDRRVSHRISHQIYHQTYQGVLQPQGFPGLPAGWNSEWETFLSADQKVQLFGVLHSNAPAKAPAKSRAPRPLRVLVISHGLGEHGGRYLHFPHYLEKAVDAVYCLDHRGHGRAEGLRGHIERFDLFCEDLALAIRRLEDRLARAHGSVELHLLGHSLGGLIALRTLFAEPKLPIRSIALSAPMLGIRVEVPMFKRMAAGALSRLWGSLQMLNELDPNDLSHDAAVREAYVQDRLVHKKVTSRLFTQMVGAMGETRKKGTGLSYPLLLMLAGEDRITDTGAATAFFQALKHRDKQLKTYAGFFHEPFNEVGKEKVFEDLAAWIMKNAGD